MSESVAFHVDHELKEFVESGVAVLVGTVDAADLPYSAYAWGGRVHPGGRSVSVYVERPRSERLLSGYPAKTQVALTFTDPVSVRSIQLKGRIAAVGEANESERSWVAHHRELFATTTALVGDPPHAIRNLWMEDDALLRIEVEVEQGFDQTPGARAGAAL